MSKSQYCQLPWIKPDLTELVAVDYVATPDVVDLQSYRSIDALAAAILALRQMSLTLEV